MAAEKSEFTKQLINAMVKGRYTKYPEAWYAGKSPEEILAMGGLNQSELARTLKCHRATISNWLHGSKEPGLDAIIRLANALHISTDELLGRAKRVLPDDSGFVECKGYRWVEGITELQTPSQRETMKIASDVIRATITGKSNLPKKPDKLYQAVKMAFASGLRFLEVPSWQDKEILANLLNITSDNVHIIPVASKVEIDWQVTRLVKTEFCAFVAAKEALAKSPADRVLLGGGYTMFRMASLSTPSELFQKTKWISLVGTADAFSETPWRRANHIATLLAEKHYGSEAFLLPYIRPERRFVSEDELGIQKKLPKEKVAFKVVSESELATCAFISVGALNPDAPKPTEGFKSTERDHKPKAAIKLLKKLYARKLQNEFVAEILGGAYDKNANQIENLDEFVYTPAGVPHLRSIVDNNGLVWIVSTGRHKWQAIQMMINYGIANALITDSNVASEIIHAHPYKPH